MFWLIAHMWFLLLCAFALGIGIGWWVWGAQTSNKLPERATAPGGDDDVIEQGSLSEEASLADGNGSPNGNGRRRYKSAKNGEKDDLTQIIGLDKDAEKTLNRLGVFYLYQIADWGPARIKWIEEKIGEEGRVERERWVAQARTLRLQNEYEDS